MKKFSKKIFSFILIMEAKLVLRKYKPKIAVITGSVGKSLAKEAMYTVFGADLSTEAKLAKKKIRKNKDGSHDELGIALTVLGIDPLGKNIFQLLKEAGDGLLLAVFRHD